METSARLDAVGTEHTVSESALMTPSFSTATANQRGAQLVRPETTGDFDAPNHKSLGERTRRRFAAHPKRRATRTLGMGGVGAVTRVSLVLPILVCPGCNWLLNIPQGELASDGGALLADGQRPPGDDAAPSPI